MHQLAPAHVQRTRGAVAAANLQCVAQVHESDRATDLAIALRPDCLAVVRCVEQAVPEDHAALATMKTEGDFVWAGLLHSSKLRADWPGRIEAFHLSELPRLIKRLRELQRVARS